MGQPGKKPNRKNGFKTVPNFFKRKSKEKDYNSYQKLKSIFKVCLKQIN